MSSLGIELDTFLALCDKAGTPLAYKSGLLARAGKWRDLVLQDIDPKSYSCAATYLMDAQVVAFFRKYPGLDLGIDRKKVAIEGFFKAEASCYRANERISPLLFTRGHYGDRIDTLCRCGEKRCVAPWAAVPQGTSSTRLLVLAQVLLTRTSATSSLFNTK